MFERFTRDARQVVRSAETLAAGLGSPTTEAEGAQADYYARYSPGGASASG